ncbi:MAG: type IV pilus secretin PilQ [Acidobacteriota bacterium]|nr:type IV pilus secretin PilQ [Acidobacteriota bacterium]
MAWNRSATLRADRAESTAARPSGCALAARLFVALTLTAAIGCASRGRGTGAQAAAGTPPSPATSTARATAHVQEAAFIEDGDGARLVLSADAPLLYTAYEPRPDLLVVDLPGIGLSDKFSAPTATGSLVQSIRVEPITEMGKQVTRLTVAHREGAHFDIRSLGQGLALSFEGSDPAAATTTADAGMAASAAPAVETREIARAPQTRGEPAHALEEIRAASANGEVTVSLLGDGAFSPKTFALENPPRVVIDLPGVKNDVRRRSMAVKSDLVTRVRVSQFSTSPELITRIVLDLSRPAPHSVRTDGERLAVVVGGSGSGETVATAVTVPPPPPLSKRASRTRIAAMAPAAEKPADPAPAAVSPEPAAPTAEAPRAEPVYGTTKTAEPVRETVKSAEPVREAVKTDAHVAAEPVPMHEVPAAAPAPARQEPVSAPPVRVAAAPIAPAPAPVADAPARPAAPLTDTTLHSRADEAIRTASAEGTKIPGGIKPSRKASRTTTAPAKSTPREEALFEGAAAVLQQEDTGRPAGAGSPAQNAAFQPKTITEAQTQFTGEPISLDLKDADIKDVFRTISQLTQLNIVVDPEVRGTVTVQLEDVPWDQALDLILKQNGLGYVLENNIMRIATSAKLQTEQSDRARLAEARQAAEPTRTLIKKLSYARAGEISNTIKSVMSKRGDIVIDARTNTLIIREIPTYLSAVLQLIDQLDTATPQVMIESRIVETTKSLGRSLGINWGVNGNADVAHGNSTNLVFPNSIIGTGRVGLGTGPTVASIRLGNILDTFNLDLALTAAENQGLLKIISSPKVAALTNTAASIQSGVQIPVQTNVNNTTTVIYIDATLRLTVTPQITNEGTVLLDVQVSKREPAVALNLSLGSNVPLTIREYKGQILVRDGGTTVIGGIFQINDQDQTNMIPGLWKIPILGNLFQNKTRTEKHDELLIFITPRILRS